MNDGLIGLWKGFFSVPYCIVACQLYTIFDILGKRKARLANRSKDDFTRTAESIRNDDRVDS